MMLREVMTHNDAYDVLLVGTGLTAASVAARLLQSRPKSKVIALESRSHVAGNCYDELDEGGTRIHRYGPHLFHSPSPRIVEFLSAYTEWRPLQHAVTAEIDVDGRLQQVPFPYSKRSVEALGRELSVTEIVSAFFRGYSQKMWGCTWEELPTAVRARVPTGDKIVPEASSYFAGQFTALPRDGYTSMIERMFEGAEVRLGMTAAAWLGIPAKHIVYTGRPDLLPLPDAEPPATLGKAYNITLPYRTLDLLFAAASDWTIPTSVLNVCHERVAHTRQTCYRLLTGGNSDVVSTEYPRDALPDEPTPFYPVISEENRKQFACLKTIIQKHYPTLTLAGRLGTYQYLDMYQAVGQGIAVAEKLLLNI